MDNEQHLRKWRLILGGEKNDGTAITLNKEDLQIDKTLEALYDSTRQGGLGPSSPNVSRWLGDIRQYFPSSVVQVMQQDALKRLNLTQMLFEKEMLENVEADVHLVAMLMSLSRVIPEKTKDTARQVVKKVVDELIRKLSQPTQQAITGSLNRSIRNRRPRHNEINWHLTIKKNLQHYQPDYKTVIPETLIGYGRKRSYCQQIISRPTDTVLVLVTDLFEGGNEEGMRKRATELAMAGVQVVVLLALNDEGAPSYDQRNAQFLSELGIPVFACTPDKFPDMMAMALSKQDIAQWAAKEDIVLKK